MAFDDATRGRLQTFVTKARLLLTDEFTKQFQQDFGLDPSSGSITPMESMAHLDDQRLATARLLREIYEHYLPAAMSTGAEARKATLDRMVREQAFTALNRLAALRMMEARGLVIECVGKGYQSQAFQLYQRVAGSALGETGDAYRVFLLSLFDVYCADLPVLFDRHYPNGRLFPREPAILPLLDLINASEVAPLWAEDETIGWIYQYFNSKDERKAMRDASQAPRNSRELAVRNQFFTPRYVVEFLVDNTLGRLWFNLTGGQTALRDRCQYLLVKPDESPEPARRLRDPRTIKLLDPACGSMHFGLYAFDLFMDIYREAWAWEQQHGPGCLDVATGGSPDLKPLCLTYADEIAFMREAPRLIIENNIFGVDIDPRAAQIASLALWLRAQRAWHDDGVKALDRPAIGRGHVAAAVAPPAEEDLRKRFMESLDPQDAELFERTLFMLKGLPELGVLLQFEKELPALMRKVFGATGDLLKTHTRSSTWAQIETRLRNALADYAQAARASYQGRLFIEDALQGFRVIDTCREVFDVVVMNPPFGEFSEDARPYAKLEFASGSHDILAAFVETGLRRLRPTGFLGAITSRTVFFAPTTVAWRQNVILDHQICSWIDLGEGVLDDALVETCAYVIENSQPHHQSIFARSSADLGGVIAQIKGEKDHNGDVFRLDQSKLSMITGSPFAYWLEPELFDLVVRYRSAEEEGIQVRVGLQTGDDFRFIRCWWEVPLPSSKWLRHAKGGENEPYATDIHLVVNWASRGAEMKAQDSIRLNVYSKIEPSEGLPPGLTFPYRTHRFSPAIMPANTITGVAGMGVYVNAGDLFAVSTIMNSSIFNELVDVRLGLREINALYQAGTVSPVPYPQISAATEKDLARLGRQAWLLASSQMAIRETSHHFCGYQFDSAGIRKSVQCINFAWSEEKNKLMVNHQECDKLVGSLYGISPGTVARISERNSAKFAKSFPDEIINNFEIAEALVCQAIMKLAGGDSRLWAGPHPTDEIIDEYARGLPDKNSHLFNSNFIHQCFTSNQISTELNNIIDKTFGNTSAIYAEFLDVTGYDSIEEFIDSPAAFFDLHLKSYTRSRRKAPIYWPLSTKSGKYTIWIYYPSLTSQTLYTAVNDFLEGPDGKLKQVEREAVVLRGKDRSRDEDGKLEALQELEAELIDLRDTLLRIAASYRPNHDDGVQITAAPLWPLFRHKPWQKLLKETWTKLAKGDYDWAHLALAYSPDRVREKCKTDKSLAIAHGLEHLYIEPAPKPAKARGKKGAGA